MFANRALGIGTAGWLEEKGAADAEQRNQDIAHNVAVIQFCRQEPTCMLHTDDIKYLMELE